MTGAAARDALVTLERQFWTSDAAFHDTHLTDDCVMVFPGLGILSRDAAMAGLAGAARWREIDMSEVRVVTLGADVMLVVYAAVARRDGMDAPYRASVSSTYVRRAGGWQLAFHQQTM